MSIYPTEITLTYNLHDAVSVKDPYSGRTMCITTVEVTNVPGSNRLKLHGCLYTDQPNYGLLHIIGDDNWPDNKDPLFLSLTKDEQAMLTEMYYSGYKQRLQCRRVPGGTMTDAINPDYYQRN